MNRFQRALATVIALCAVGASIPAALAQGTYPNKPIRMLIAYPPGAGIDITGRRIWDMVSTKLKGTIVIDNRPGGGGSIAAAEVARAPGDGYVLFNTLPGPLVGGPCRSSRSPTIRPRTSNSSARSTKAPPWW